MAGIAPKYYYLTLGLLAACVIIGFYIAVRLQREVNEDLGPTTEKDLLDPLEKAFYSGLMDEAEFRRIQESLGKHGGKPAAKVAGARPKPGKIPQDGGDIIPLPGDGGPYTSTDDGLSGHGDADSGHVADPST